MASSAKFLEEALSTDVDESAVSAIVGSLENQLGTPTSVVSCQQISSTNVNQNHLPSNISNGSSASAQKHGTANGQADTMSIILNSESIKGITSNSHPLGNITPTITNSTVQGIVSSASFANQISSNVGIVQASSTNLTKTQDGLKTVFTTIQSAVSSANTPRVAYPMQNVNSLPNGNLNVTSLPSSNVLSATSSNIQGMVSQTFTQSNSSYHKVTPVGTEQKPGTAVIIQSNACNNISTGVSSQMTSAITLSGSQLNNTVTLAKPTTASGAQTIVGNAPILSNLQLVNINALRTTTPTQVGNKTTASPRLMIPQVVRPGGAPGQITLQALPAGIQNAQGGHLLLKTENGHFQLVRLGPPASTTVTQNSAATGLPAGSYRLTVPVCSVAQTSTTTSTVQTVTTQSAIQSGTVQRGVDNSREKCRKFLTNLLELSSREPKAVERNVSTLIQELIDGRVEPEAFCDRLERLLNASPQPCLIGFLKKSLPGLRAAMITKELTIDGIRAPPAPTQPATVVLAAPSNVVQAQIQNNQIRPVQIGSMSQMRVVPQSTLATGTRPQQQIQHRIITPVRLQTASSGPTNALSGVKVVTTPTMPTVATTVRIQSPLPTSAADSASATTASVQLVPSSSGGATIMTPSATATSTPIRLPTSRPTLVKTMSIRTTAATTPVTVRTSTTASSASKSAASSGMKNHFVSKSPMLAGIGRQQSSSQSKGAAKEKERKAAAILASSAAAAAAAAAAAPPVTALAGGYVGDDDVNDVAAMAGVNLAEETQRILGPSEFVGTQIRSCKDETFLHTHPLTMRISQIVKKHGLDEPSSEVVALVSHAAQERLRGILEKLNVIAEHRVDFNKADNNYEMCHDIRGQLRFLEELDKVERKRHDEMERELLLRAAKSRSKSEDPEQVKLKAKAKELQRAEMEELRQREANLTALQAIGPRKRIKLDMTDGTSSSTSVGSASTNTGANRLSLANRPRLKRVTARDFLYVMEKDKHIKRSPFLYKSYLK